MDIVTTTVKIIEAVRNRPILYRIDLPEYKNVADKHEAWKEVAEETGISDVAVLKTKWKNLRDSYRKHTNNSVHYNSTSAAKKYAKWTWAEQMSFIDPPYEEGNIKQELQDANTIYIEATSDHDEDMKPERGPVSSELDETIQESYANNIQQDPVDVSIRVKRKGSLNQRTKNTRKLKTKPSRLTQVECDGLDLLFLGYANTFKKLSRRRQAVLKYNISKMFMEAEIQDLNEDEF